MDQVSLLKYEKDALLLLFIILVNGSLSTSPIPHAHTQEMSLTSMVESLVYPCRRVYVNTHLFKMSEQLSNYCVSLI
jgi:hypothetical protein